MAVGILVLNVVVSKDPVIVGDGPVVQRPTPSVSPALSPTPGASRSALPNVSPSQVTPSPDPAATTPPSVQPLAPRRTLVVLNNSRRTGLAARAAAQFERGGWPVRDTDNYRSGTLEETTVFYPPGFEASARRLLGEFSSVKRMAPRLAGMASDALTVVVTRDYPA